MTSADKGFGYCMLAVATLIVIVGIALWIQEIVHQHRERKIRKEKAIKRLEAHNRLKEQEKGKEVDYFGIHTNVFK